MSRLLTAIIQREGDGFVALCPEVDVASQGDTVEAARHNLQEALELFFECASPAEVQQRLTADHRAYPMILLIDNYDSFTYNLVQRLGELDPTLDVQVRRNDQITADEAAEMRPSHIIISPGPCTPREAGVSNEILKRFAATVPTLGVCLGHQCIGHVFGGEVVRNVRVMHGKTSPIRHDDQGVFRGLSNPFEATRYHSLVIKRETFHNPDFVVGAWTDEGEIMGVRHRTWPLHGVQFHPESFLTVEGPRLLRNFLDMRM